MIPLFERYPSLGAALPFVSLGRYPTPVLDAANLDPEGRCAAIAIKHDGVSGTLYGGNKVRKLEFLLADAQQRGKSGVLTFGGAGSNHALATAIYARELGLDCDSLLIKQPNSYSVRSNLLRSLQTGAHLQHFESMTGLVAGTLARAALKPLSGKAMPYFIPPGGSSALGLLGYVNAAFELQAQIERGILESPDVIYIACGTMGSCVGLALGLRLLGLNTRVCSVAVTDTRFSSLHRAQKLLREANDLLRAADASIAKVQLDDCEFELRHDFFGEEYGRYTEAGMAAVRRAGKATGLKLEGCYTGKCAAALLHDLGSGRLEGQRVLLWNTYDAQSAAQTDEGLDYHQLPRKFHQYFDSDVQLQERKTSDELR
jgi:D-cysteine desulfhydrase